MFVKILHLQIGIIFIKCKCEEYEWESICDQNITKYICDESICELFVNRELFAEHCSIGHKAPV